MEPGIMRSGGSSGSGVLVKNRNSSGCLIVRKKRDGLGASGTATPGVGSSASRKFYDSKKRAIVNTPLSDSGSSDELPMPSARRLGHETLRACNSWGMVGGSEASRKRNRVEQIRGNGEGMMAENALDMRERKHNKSDAFDFHEGVRRRHFDHNGVGLEGGGRLVASAHTHRTGIDREFETGSSRHTHDNRKNLYYDRQGGLYPVDNVDPRRFKMIKEEAQLPPPLLRNKFNSEDSIRIQGKNGVLKVLVNKKKVGVGGPLENRDHHKTEDGRPRVKAEGSTKRNVLIHPSSYLEAKPVEKPGLLVRPAKKQMVSKKSLSIKESMRDELDSDDSDASPDPGVRNTEAPKPAKRIVSEDENTKRIVSEDGMHENTLVKEGKIKRGSGTEKQKLREKIREMLLNAGWTIDYRPRRNRDYLDSVYINPAGTAYWSIIKAYEALQKQLNDDAKEAKIKGDSSSFAPIADEVLSQLTRKTRKKMEKELKMKNKKKKRHDNKNDSVKEPRVRSSASNKHDMNSIDSDSNEEKLSTFMKQGSKSMKNKMIENTISSAIPKSLNATHHSDDEIEKSFSLCNPNLLDGQKSRKLGRCTLLVRSSNKGLNSEPDGFVPYTGKRTVLSWLIDSGTVALSQKVQYRRRKKVMLEGWITRDGIHCGCCSKILTISKFELHAGSKLPQPYQNIFLESGVSLLQCQIDAWNRQNNSEKIGFHMVDPDGDDPNDDTCGRCGDGGDLICCDGCPSTFHQSCLGIQMLPPGEWRCPNCTCKFCGIAGGTSKNEVDATEYALRTCNLCERKYHASCAKEIDVLPNNLNSPGFSFCGKECKELFEHLKKYLGTKHELEAGFSWSLIRRTNEDSEAASWGITHRVECNSKLAIAQTVMDECFLPVVDRRSGINLIHNALYNSGSNFSRLSYSGFYTFILERGDEMISAASIRFHGNKLVEMPFIGTRYIYRRQGMCRRLFAAIESVLCFLKVEKLVIPAIADLTQSWITVFGFTHLEESLKQEMKSLNMLVFPGIDMLQKLVVGQEKHEASATAAGPEKTRNGDKAYISTKMADGSDMSSSTHGSDDTSSDSANEMNDECSNASQEINNGVVVPRTTCSKSSEGRSSDSVSDKCVSPSSTSRDVLEMENKTTMACPVDKLNLSSSKCQSISLNDTSVSSHPSDVPHCHEVQALVQETTCSDPSSAKNFDKEHNLFGAMNCDSSELDVNPVLDSPVADNTLPSKEAYMSDTYRVLEAVPSKNLSEEDITKENIDEM